MSYLTLLRWPRSSGGSLQSLTASMTAERRSINFFSAFGDLPGDDDGGEDAEEEEEHLAPEMVGITTITGGDLSCTADLCNRERNFIDLRREVAMSEFTSRNLGFTAKNPPKKESLALFTLSITFLAATQFPRRYS